MVSDATESANPAGRAAAMEELRRRVITTLVLIAAYALFFEIPVLGIKPAIVRDLLTREGSGRTASSLFLAFSRTASVMVLGVRPFVTAMVLGLLARRMFPGFARRLDPREGLAGIETWARSAMIPLSILQGWVALRDLARHSSKETVIVPDPGLFAYYIPGIAALVAGASIAVWLARQIDRHGIGNGILTLAGVDVIARLAQEWRRIPDLLRDTERLRGYLVGYVIGAFILFGLVATLLLVHRKIALARSTPSPEPAGHLLLGLCPAAAWPILGAAFEKDLPRFFGVAVVARFPHIPLYDAGWLIVIGHAAFAFILSLAASDSGAMSRKISRTLAERGLEIPGVRPGRRTWRFLALTSRRFAFAGATALAVIFVLSALLGGLWLGEVGFSRQTEFFGILVAATAASAWMQSGFRILGIPLPRPAEVSP